MARKDDEERFEEYLFRLKAQHQEVIEHILTERNSTRRHKKLFLHMYGLTGGNITESCRLAHIKSTKTFYNWIHSDPAFKKDVDHVLEYEADFADDAVKYLVMKGNPATVRFHASRRSPKYMPPRRLRHMKEMERALQGMRFRKAIMEESV